MVRSAWWLLPALAGLASAAYACFGDVYGGTHPIGEDCEYGCEIGHEDGPHTWGTPATTSPGGHGGEGGSGAGGGGGGAGQGGIAGTGGAAGSGQPGGHGGEGGG
jgi:hypothetical protein